MTLTWLALACSVPTIVGPDLDVSVHAVDLSGAGGTLVVTTVYPSSMKEAVELPGEPAVQGLTFELRGAPRQERLGDRTVVTQEWKFSGKKGSYEVLPLTVSAGERAAMSTPVWVDLGVEAPNLAQLADIAEPTEMWEIPLLPVLCVLGGLGTMGGMIVFAFTRAVRPREKVVVKIAPDVRCLRAWELVLDDPSLTPDDRAKELSRIFREYTEEVLNFPAASWTTTQILEHLEGMQHLPKGNIPRAKKLLRATDLVKYAEISPGSTFFDEMDADLRAFVGSTRPVQWEQEAKDG
jgi:hypothetical protein